MAANQNFPIIQDLSVLNCPLRTLSLTIPSFQCLHSDLVVCCHCWLEVKAGCDSCAGEERSNRCKVVEDMLESIRSTCPNEEFGCRETIPYLNLRNHMQKLCRYSPCYCPLFNECDYAAHTAFHIYQHYVTAHRIDNKNYAFFFGKPKRVLVHDTIGVDIMHCKGTSILFSLEKFKTSDGVYLDLSYVAPLGTNLGPFAYRITKDDISAEYENPEMKRVNPAINVQPSITSSLFVPNSCIRSRRFTIVVCIWKVELI